MGEITELYEINSNEHMICLQCGEERRILSKGGVCIFCLRPIKRGTEVKKSFVDKKGGGIVKVAALNSIKEYI